MWKLQRIIVLLLISHFVHGQTSEYEQEQYFSAEQLKRDFNILVESIKDVHPSADFFIEEVVLDSLIEVGSLGITDSLTASAFHILVRAFIRNIRCGHTTARPSSNWYVEQKKSSKLLPFEVLIVKDKVYIRQAFDNDSLLLPGVELLFINDKPIKTIVADMRGIQEVDGYSTAYETKRIERLFRTYFLFLHGRHDFYQITYLDEYNQRRQTEVKGGLSKTKSSSLSTSNEANLEITGAYFFTPSDTDDLGVLKISSFTTKGYKKFYKAVFEAVEDQNINYLVLDLRGNGGGYFPNGNYLLRYLLADKFEMTFSRPKNKIKKQAGLRMDFLSKLTKQAFNLMPDQDKNDPNRNYAIHYRPMKKNAYNGKLYVLTDGGTFSMGSYVAAKLKHHTDCILLGSETGGGEMGSNAILMYNLTLPETGIRVRIPFYFLDHNVSIEEKGRGVIPTIEMQYSLEELLQGIDKEMQQIKSWIESE